MTAIRLLMCAGHCRQIRNTERLCRTPFPPAALPFLEEIAQAAQRETRKHFGNSVNMFTPLYIANYCENYCIYCGFNCHNKIRRAMLNAEQIDMEMAAIAKSGLQEILILTGESRVNLTSNTSARHVRLQENISKSSD